MVAKHQAERLAARGHRVVVVTSKVNNEEASGTINGVQVTRVPAWNGLEGRGVPFPVFKSAILKVLKGAVVQADVVHIHDAMYMSSLIAVFMARTYRKPVIITQHVGLVQHPAWWVVRAQKIMHGTVGRWVFGSGRVVFTLNDRVMSHARRYGARSSRLKPIANGVDIELFSPVSSDEKLHLRKRLGLSIDKPIVLFVGRFVPKKGFDKVMAARDGSYQIVFAGGEADPFTANDIVLIGKLNQKELADYYRAADVFVLPSEGEGFPLSIQEAMAAGLPIITTYDDGYGRYNLDAQLFKMLHQPNAHSVRAAIKSVLQNNDLRRAMSLYSRDYASKYFGWDKVITELEHAYDSAMPRVAA
jgi:D-inositol-3-phosphate glycosyltransferase